MENIKLTLPDSWSEISLGTYQEIISIESKSDAGRLKDLIFILTGKDISKVSTSELQVINNALSFMQVLPDEKNFKKVITINNVEYGLIQDFNSISVGEWIDMEELLKDKLDNLHKIMALLYRPLISGVVQEYDANTLNARAEIFEEYMMIGDIYGTMVFFLITGMEFTKHFLLSLEELK